jgi:hypothetical protein
MPFDSSDHRRVETDSRAGKKRPFTGRADAHSADRLVIERVGEGMGRVPGPPRKAEHLGVHVRRTARERRKRGTRVQHAGCGLVEGAVAGVHRDDIEVIVGCGAGEQRRMSAT